MPYLLDFLSNPLKSREYVARRYSGYTAVDPNQIREVKEKI
jgi:hypothetical protein